MRALLLTLCAAIGCMSMLPGDEVRGGQPATSAPIARAPEDAAVGEDVVRAIEDAVAGEDTARDARSATSDEEAPRAEDVRDAAPQALDARPKEDVLETTDASRVDADADVEMDDRQAPPPDVATTDVQEERSEDAGPDAGPDAVADGVTDGVTTTDASPIADATTDEDIGSTGDSASEPDAGPDVAKPDASTCPSTCVAASQCRIVGCRRLNCVQRRCM